MLDVAARTKRLWLGREVRYEIHHQYSNSNGIILKITLRLAIHWRCSFKGYIWKRLDTDRKSVLVSLYGGFGSYLAAKGRGGGPVCAFAILFSALLFRTVIANNSVHYRRYCYCQNLNLTKVPRMTSNVILITISPRASEEYRATTKESLVHCFGTRHSLHQQRPDPSWGARGVSRGHLIG